MNVTLTTATFDGDVPIATEIARAIDDITGQRVTVEDRGVDAGTVLNASLSFTSFPGSRVFLSAYDGEAVREHQRRTGMAGTPVGRSAMGADDAPGTHTVYVLSYGGTEPTLFFVTGLALESLGGRRPSPADESARRKYSVRISDAELDRRHRAARRWDKLFPLIAPFALLLLIASIPWLVGYWLWRSVRRPAGAGR